VTRQDDDHRVACATLTYLAEPADQYWAACCKP
jgi:hypothetical protein